MMAADPRWLRQGFLTERDREPPRHHLRRQDVLVFTPVEVPANGARGQDQLLGMLWEELRKEGLSFAWPCS